MNNPYEIGDAHDVVAILHMDYDTLSFLADELPQNDGFTKELQQVRLKVEEDKEVAKYEREYRN